MSNEIRIFDEQLALKPDRYPWAVEFIYAMHDGHWTDKEFNFASDIQDFHVNLNDQEREVITRALSCISQIEVSVKTFWGKLGETLPHPSLIDLGYTLASQEVTHGLAYSRLLGALGIEDIFEKNLELPWIKGRVNYLKKYTKKVYKDKNKQFLYALTLFTLFIENVSLFSQFYIINWFNTHQNVLKATTQQTGYTNLEEQQHGIIGTKLINTIKEEYPELFDDELKDRIKHEAEEAFKAESVIVDWMLNGKVEEHLSPDILKDFIKNRINDSLTSIGIEKLFEVNEENLEKTLWFDESVLGNNSTDFFARRPVEYSKKSQSFDTDDLFE